MAAADLTISAPTLAASIFNFLNEIGNKGEKEGNGACNWAMLAMTNPILSQEIALFISLDVIKSNLGRVFSIVPPSMVKACGSVK
ncbi:unnamed protein product [Linum trigynum]|uniref:Uncharacterized protein n=1 Tax=Linum trigynum TaxID=586398 RepID=A0AAV2CZW8_9ROSI